MLSKHILRWFYYIFLICCSLLLHVRYSMYTEKKKYSCSVSFYLYVVLKCCIHKTPWNSFSKEHTEDGLSTQDRKNVFIF